MIFRNLTLHLIAENAPAKRIAVDQQDWYAAMATLLDCEAAMGGGHQLLLRGYAHVTLAFLGGERQPARRSQRRAPSYCR
jgi:hypothetical protein